MSSNVTIAVEKIAESTTNNNGFEVDPAIAVYQLTDPLLKFSWYPESESLYLKHLHEIAFSFAFYLFIHIFIAPYLNHLIFGKNYTSIQNRKSKMDFDVHIVSMFQAFISVAIVLPVIRLPVDLNVATFQNEWCSMVSSVSVGYFIWDFIVCVSNYNIYGLEFLAHAIGSLYCIGISLYPFVQNWVPKFLIVEASTPFVNVNWFISQLLRYKVKVPVWLNVINGVLLMTVFFSIRIVWGFTAIGYLSKQIWITRYQVPIVHTFLILLLNTLFNCLNLFWFSKMIRIVKKMAMGSKKETKSSKRD
ncbi:hypothetical protein TBLA_0F02830 [Henningerozyma blattae CBS 6284]|uniref:TLC domain-containing protein n=1 Tax=Henningerozyma blattae (strain ATCC 34711 / CBS 6284 / DSM 70876 / NBRC 10599 / NRRL Y-10934 / UCD 77-7) TaxID=1071380 RepID=I2H620_HENB6|nr:hypothetical protein TBLA_0F02830 [Tetrapisispora blattae CBS 6284]CCH61822.1 hypothetical protein TBLA_0F02830 [Tetrapisispora blattae CBS 6284]